MDAFIRTWRTPVITQHNPANLTVSQGLSAPGHQVLFDASGGRGISPEGYRQALPGKACGYAGGIGPENVRETLITVATLGGPEGFWIDMEGKLRGEDDEFLLDRCEAVLEAVAAEIPILPLP